MYSKSQRVEYLRTSRPAHHRAVYHYDNVPHFGYEVKFYSFTVMENHLQNCEAEGGEEPEDGSHTEEAAEDSGDERATPERGVASKGGQASESKRATKVEKHVPVPAFKANFDPAINYGHQSKMIRCYVLHQFVYQFVYGLPEGTKPTVYNR